MAETNEEIRRRTVRIDDRIGNLLFLACGSGLTVMGLVFIYLNDLYPEKANSRIVIANLAGGTTIAGYAIYRFFCPLSKPNH